MSVRVLDAITQELTQLSATTTAPGLAATAQALASLIDDSTGPTAAANAARELRQIMVDLRELAPVEGGNDVVTKLNADREARRLKSV